MPSFPACETWPPRRVVPVLAALFLFFAYPLGFVPNMIGANESAHAYLALALAHRGSAQLDVEVDDYIFNHDLVLRGGHWYSNKPPGLGIWLVPAVWVLDLVSGGPAELIPLLYWGRLLTVTLPFVIFLYFLGRRLEKLAPPAAAWGLVLAYALGTNAGAYVTMNFTHGLAAMLLGTAYLLLWSDRPGLRFLAGLAAGYAVVTEYQAVAVAAVLALLALWNRDKRFSPGRALAFALGAGCTAAVLFYYQAQVFGSPTTVSYAPEFQGYGMPIHHYGFTAPSLKKFLAFFFSPALGIFFYSPWLLAVGPAVWWLRRRPRTRERQLLWGALAAGLALPVMLACHHYWVGGAIIGPRYLCAGILFFTFPVAAWLGRLTGRARRRAAMVLGSAVAVAVVVHFLLLLTVPANTTTDVMLQNPIRAFAFPLLAAGRTAATVLTYLGPYRTASALLFVLLLLLPLGLYAVPLLRRTGAWDLGGAVVLGGGALFLLWTQLGRPQTHYSRFHLPRILQRTDPQTLPREASGRLHYMRRPRGMGAQPVTARTFAFHPAFRRILPEKITLRHLAEECKFLRGPVWHRGAVYVSDVAKNLIYRVSPAGSLETFRTWTGYHWPDVAHLLLPGTNGLAFDGAGRLYQAEVGSRRISRVEPDGRVSLALAEYEGARFQGPADVVLGPDGAVYFTDTAATLELNRKPLVPQKLLPAGGIYCLRGGRLEQLAGYRPRDGAGVPYRPSGLAFSPDGRFLYVCHDPYLHLSWLATLPPPPLEPPPRIFRFPFHPEQGLGRPTFIDFRYLCRRYRLPRTVRPDVLRVDREGNLYVGGPAGVLVLTPGGVPLGLLPFPPRVSGLAFGGDDRKTLFIAAHESLYALAVGIPGL